MLAPSLVPCGVPVLLCAGVMVVAAVDAAVDAGVAAGVVLVVMITLLLF